MKSMFLFNAFLAILISSCSKGGGDDTPTAPTNLTLSAQVATDNSGNVLFTATATNAVSYEYDFGNGIFETSASGTLTYKYPSSGSYTVNVKAKSASGLSISVTKQIAVTVELALIWSDEFNTAGAPNSAKWGYDIGTGSGGWGNNEIQYYTNRTENATVANGVLKITAIKENFSGSTFTSARLLTKGKFSFQYGKVEVRAKLPSGVGTWPAIWMLGDNISTVGWPACGEIDIMEHRGMEQNKIFGTLHYPGRSGGNADGTTINIANASTEFHNYKTEWTATSIKIYVDDVLFYTFANSSATPFNQKFFILLNFAIGGTFGGPVDPALTGGTMEVDYVRVYQ